RFREAPPPLTLPSEGLYLGESVFRGARKPVFVGPEDRRRHMYIIGQTGTGKSNLMNLLAQSDMRSGQGLAVIDPHGDLVDALAGSVPRDRYNDVIIFNPGDLERPMGMNMLEYDLAHPEQKTFIMNELYGILDKLYDLKVVGGPMFEQYMKNAVLLLMEDAANEPATLVELARVFTDEEFRNRKLARIANPIVIDFWEKEATQATGEHSLQNMASWITSKFNAFVANDYIRPIVSQTTSAFNIREIMDQGKILLVNLSKGRIGDVNANLMGMIIAGKILMAALSRTEVPEADRRDFHVYIDEFQNFTTDSIGIIFSEARKYRLTLTVAHQFIAQLTEKVRDAVFGNVGAVVAFRVGAPDAEFLEKQFTPTLSKGDLANVDNLNAYVRLLVGGQVVPPFNIHTPFAERGNPELRERLKELSRTRYGRDRREVEEALTKRLRE
ncbi:MAG: DUF87 domain-containing protein, partial [Candidatus Colwellbacteria bacterium]|nr:DUF87 domain-containing protein [Candidatus Colwellbacteria bacterium]